VVDGVRESNRDRSGVIVREGFCCDRRMPAEDGATPGEVGVEELGVDHEKAGAGLL